MSREPLPRWAKIAFAWIFVGACVSITFMIIGGIATYQNYQRVQAAHVQPTALPTQQSTMEPTATSKPHPIQYPPKTEADLRGLAAAGDASAIHMFKSESVGLTGVCPQPKREITVDSRITGRQLAEDLLAYFYSEQLDSSCGSIVFAFHKQAEESSVGYYTAGRIKFDVTDSNGNINTDQNATNLKHTLTLDIGGFMENQKEYVVTY